MVDMEKNIQELLKQFENEHEVLMSADDMKSYWIITARIPEKQGSHHHGRKFISGRNEEGNVLVFSNPEIMDVYSIENWGDMKTFEDFVDKALAALRTGMMESEQKLQEGCGTGCS
jgi:hypothetical protein